jgi:hypothetical protein
MRASQGEPLCSGMGTAAAAAGKRGEGQLVGGLHAAAASARLGQRHPRTSKTTEAL